MSLVESRNQDRVRVVDILVKAALSSNPPLLTDDPIANHKVDYHQEDRNVPFDINLYLQEIYAWRQSGGYVLSYSQRS